MNKSTPWDVIKLLESDNSRLFKEDVIRREIHVDNIELFEGFKHCLDSLITFGIKKVPVKNDGDIHELKEGLNWSTFKFYIDQLSSREVTGNKAIYLVNELMSLATVEQWNFWYRRILLKDLNCGVSEKTINNVVTKGNRDDLSVPVFSCQLASPSEDHSKKMYGEKMVDVKMDGARVISILYPDGIVEQFSRNGKALENFPNIVEQLKRYTKRIFFPVVLDGEVMSSSFQDLMKQLHRKEEVHTDDAILHLFDMIPLDQFLEGYCEQTQIIRRKTLENLIEEIPVEERLNVDTIDYEIINLDNKEGSDRLLEINKFAIDNGFEGIMIKDTLAPYECKRTTSWLKLKPFITVDLEVIGFEEGTKKNVGKLGALICRGEDKDRIIEVNVGSGFTDFERDFFWKNKEDLLGKICEVKADAVTKSQESEDVYSLRFPSFLFFRNDK